VEGLRHQNRTKKTPKNQKALWHPQRQVANLQTSSRLRRLEQTTPLRRNANQKTKNQGKAWGESINSR
jgi:hypothetical protein